MEELLLDGVYYRCAVLLRQALMDNGIPSTSHSVHYLQDIYLNHYLVVPLRQERIFVQVQLGLDEDTLYVDKIILEYNGKKTEKVYGRATTASL